MSNAIKVKAAAASKLPAGVEHGPVQAPHFYGSGFQASWTSNQVSITLQRPTPAAAGVTGFAFLEPTAVMHFSPQSAKDLSILLAEGVAKYEEQWGEIRTEFTESRKTGPVPE